MAYFRLCCVQIVASGILDGFNATVFAYGATGAGKTYTMVGNEANPGVMTMTIADLFALMEADEKEVDYRVTVSYIELYNELIHDLLVSNSDELELREDSQGNSVVCGATRLEIQSPAEMMKLLQAGNRRRTIEATMANEVSSRSHAILEVQVDRTSNIRSAEKVVHTGRLFMIDLAGSERAAATQNNGQRMVEGQHINRSLLALGNCINSLGSGQRAKYVNFRDSKLTRILKLSLGGNCRTVMIACASPAGNHFEESYNTMNYANRAKNIKTTATTNSTVVKAHVAEYGKIIDGLKSQVASLQSQLKGKRPARSTSPAPSAPLPAPAATRDVGGAGPAVDADVGPSRAIREVEEACQQQVMTRKKIELLTLKESHLTSQGEDLVRRLKLAKREGSSGLGGPMMAQELSLLKEELKALDDVFKANARTKDALAEQSDAQLETISRLTKQLNRTGAAQHCKSIMKIHELEMQNLRLSFAANAQRREVENKVLARTGDLRDRIIAEQKALLDKFMDRPPTALMALYTTLETGSPTRPPVRPVLVPAKPKLKPKATSKPKKPTKFAGSPESGQVSSAGDYENGFESSADEHDASPVPPSQLRREQSFRSTRSEQPSLPGAAAPRVRSGLSGVSRPPNSASRMASGAGAGAGTRPSNPLPVSKARVQSGVSAAAVADQLSSSAAGKALPELERDSSFSSVDDDGGPGLSQTYSKDDLRAAMSRTYSALPTQSGPVAASTEPTGATVTTEPSPPPAATVTKDRPKNPAATESVAGASSNPPSPNLALAGKAFTPTLSRFGGPGKPAIPHRKSSVYTSVTDKVKTRGFKPARFAAGQRRNVRVAKSRPLIYPGQSGGLPGFKVQASPYATSQARRVGAARRPLP